MPLNPDQPMDPSGPTGKLCLWIESITLSSIPESIKTRAKYLLLDGIACALVGAHLPWSEKAASVVLEMEPAGNCAVFGWEKASLTSPLFHLKPHLTKRLRKSHPSQPLS